MEESNEELETLNTEARELEERIAENVARCLLWGWRPAPRAVWVGLAPPSEMIDAIIRQRRGRACPPLAGQWPAEETMADAAMRGEGKPTPYELRRPTAHLQVHTQCNVSSAVFPKELIPAGFRRSEAYITRFPIQVSTRRIAQ